MTNSTLKPTKPVVLCILDGWGSREENENNAIRMADTPNYDMICDKYPSSFLQTSGMSVGLPDGQMGNSEVGHMNIGGGRVVKQELPRIDEAIELDQVKDIDCVKSSIATLKETGGTMHIMGLLSPGGVHSHQNHMIGAAVVYANAGIPVMIHGFTDGRDVPPKSALEFIAPFEAEIAKLENVKIATISGRYYAMDRDNRWDRVVQAHDAITSAIGEKEGTASEAIDAAYAAEQTDEFVKPTIIGDYQGLNDGDAVLMANFRADRAREIMATFVDPDFDGFEKKKSVKLSASLGMSKYSDHLIQYMDCLFPTAPLQDTLGQIVSDHNLKQLRIAETEKFAHVTFFFNGGNEDLYDGENRILIPSPDVATYNLKPEMSAPEVTDKLVEAITSNEYDLIVVNFANPDMVGHTGVLEAALKAVKTIDNSLGRLHEAVESAGGSMLITADHGNIELMKNPDTGAPHTAHTTNLVPFILVNGEAVNGTDVTLENGALCDVAPTVLLLMGLEQPDAMTGRNLIS
ncbi:2,3-bisphosphoglycerate-independent phosphoglycerate mutase [Pseudemcibacter aquimaris]|uniref:2,3-bisphosphoglycerate-independent phosphoglycerate mutase n=1 Tax=Pseudemcibacter aquimaris TaxID=2857064 RepID=UPI0020111A89|nr:2,3-bisphosphoglycerate-independent phosphoglycerate mutase [Pseudemcibacter aquimaris]MCC3861636.1 2,3-bisphosphoglycerate-independent phosphoglycerate mutase [Pseudemcibacter aquimaris]WDU58407.1 2,3-bisphosphoglycerate-independent phosphoglycerate mutase [Pseudemcibacter aquimaris]